MKDIGIIVTVALALIGGAISYGKVQSQVESTKEETAETREEIKEVEADVEEHDDKIHELEKFSVKQTTLMNTQALTIERIGNILNNLEK